MKLLISEIASFKDQRRKQSNITGQCTVPGELHSFSRPCDDLESKYWQACTRNERRNEVEEKPTAVRCDKCDNERCTLSTGLSHVSV